MSRLNVEQSSIGIIDVNGMNFNDTEMSSSFPHQWNNQLPESRHENLATNPYRLKPSSFNSSALSDDVTVDFRSDRSHQSIDGLFEPAEITGRSTGHNFRQPTAMSLPSTEDILRKSVAGDVRQMADALSQMKIRQSYGGRTADMSLASSVASGPTRSAMADYNAWEGGFQRISGAAMMRANGSDAASFRSSNVSSFFL